MTNDKGIDINLYDYQKAGVEFIKKNNRCGLFLDMGLGKTVIVLKALVELAQEGQLYGHTIVIAPKRIAVNTWGDEINKWSFSRGARFKVLAGLTKKKRDELIAQIPNDPPTIYVINRELVPSLVKDFPGAKWCFNNVILDEAQSFKNPSSKGFKALKSIAEYTHRWIELTGTPAPNGLMDIWSLIYLLDGGWRLGGTITEYRMRHFIPGRRTPQGYPYEWFIKDGHEDYINRLIQDIVISMSKKDYLTMPPITHNKIELDMTKKEREVYQQLKRDMVLPLMDGSSIESVNAAVLNAHLSQLANGAIYVSPEDRRIIELHDHKLNALEEIIDGANGEPVLVFYWFKHDLIRMKRKFKDRVTVFNGEPDHMKAWNEKKIPVLLAHPASAGHGLNFQYGGHILVFFSVPQSLELFEQSIGRLYRNGQTEAVIVHYLITRGTVEGKTLNSLHDKQLTQNALLDGVKAELQDLLDDEGSEEIFEHEPTIDRYMDRIIETEYGDLDEIDGY